MAMLASSIGGFRVELVTRENFYGPQESYQERQDIFSNESKKIVHEGSEKIKEALSENSLNFDHLFDDLMDTFSKERNRIAVEAGTPDAEMFGKPTRFNLDGNYLYTPLQSVYEKANEVAVGCLSESMSSMDHDWRQFHQTTKKVEETVLDRKFSYEIEIFDSQKAQPFANDIDPEITMKFHKEKIEENPEITVDEIFSKYMEEKPEYYNHSKMHVHIMNIYKYFPRPIIDWETRDLISGTTANLKSDYILVTKKAEIDGEMVPLSQWLTWAYRTFERDPVERMNDPNYRPVVVVLHQDIPLKKKTLNECKRIFTDIMKKDWRSSDIKDLKDQVGLLCYLFSEMTFFYRGTSAIGEWFEQSIYDALGFSCSYNPRFERENFDLITHSSLAFSEYLQRYHELIHIEEKR